MNLTAHFLAQETQDLLQETLFYLPNWKWLVGLSSLVVTCLLGLIFQGLFRVLFQRLQRRLTTSSYFSFFLQQPVHRPLAWIMAIGFLQGVCHALELPPGLHHFMMTTTKVGFALFLIRLIYLSVEAFGYLLNLIVQKTETTLDDQLAPFLTKVLKVVIVLLGGLVILQNFGIEVVSLLAGLGLGGLALALAAQDTAANLFGSITILLDRPFQIGDVIKVGDTEGVVDEVGFRSTRVKTAYRSLVSIPNASMAKEKIDNWGLKKSVRFRQTLGVTYSTKAQELRNFIDRIRYDLTQNSDIDQSDITVNLSSLGDFSIQILVNCFIELEDPSQLTKKQERILFDFMKAAEDLKIEFAFPTQTIFLNSERERNQS